MAELVERKDYEVLEPEHDEGDSARNTDLGLEVTEYRTEESDLIKREVYDNRTEELETTVVDRQAYEEIMEGESNSFENDELDGLLQ